MIIDSAHTWSSIVLPDDIYESFMDFPNDIRIYGQTDSITNYEVPYIFFDNYNELIKKEVSFKILNRSLKDSNYFITFENSFIEPINQIELKFDRTNFDWRVTLEGSHNQRDWFTILKDYRILSISNPLVFYNYTTLNFPQSDFLYFRVNISSNEDPQLAGALLNYSTSDTNDYKIRPIDSLRIINDTENKQTIIDVYLKYKAPVSSLLIDVKNNFDFYRPVKILYMTDTIETISGIKPLFKQISNGYLTSIQKNIYYFEYRLTKCIRIQIENYDNIPLEIDSIEVMGNICSLTGRFPEGQDFYLYYGSNNTARPRYDIDEFADKIPIDLIRLNLGNEKFVIDPTETENKNEPLNKTWLWVVMGIIIVVLGGFSMYMLKNSSRKEQ